MLFDILCVIAWCVLVFVCAFDWEDVRDAERRDELLHAGRGKEKRK